VLQLYSASFAWGIHWLAARLLLRALGVVGVAWSELLAYTGYPFVGVCAATAGGFVAGALVCGVGLCICAGRAGVVGQIGRHHHHNAADSNGNGNGLLQQQRRAVMRV
jgi:hypothetical protein